MKSLYTQGRRQGDRLGTAVDLLLRWSTVAAGIVGRAVEFLAAFSGAQGVVVCRKGVTPFSAKLILNAVNGRISREKTDMIYSQYA
jgi:hypothetical protein